MPLSVSDTARSRSGATRPALRLTHAPSIQELLSSPNLDDPAQIDAYTLLKCACPPGGVCLLLLRKDKEA